MSEALKTALKTLLLTLSQFDNHPEGVTIADESILDRGLDHLVIIWSGSLASGDSAGQTVNHTYELMFQVFVRFLNDPQADAALSIFTKNIVDLLDVYPTLNGQANITLERLAGSEPLYIGDRPPATGGPYFLMREFTLEISERVALNGGEY